MLSYLQEPVDWVDEVFEGGLWYDLGAVGLRRDDGGVEGGDGGGVAGHEVQRGGHGGPEHVGGKRTSGKGKSSFTIQR